MIDFIQTAKIKAPVITDLESLCLGDPPIYQRILFTPAPLGFVRSDSDILQGIAMLFDTVDLFCQQMGLDRKSVV